MQAAECPFGGHSEKSALKLRMSAIRAIAHIRGKLYDPGKGLKDGVVKVQISLVAGPRFEPTSISLTSGLESGAEVLCGVWDGSLVP